MGAIVNPSRRLFRVNEAAEELALSRATIYKEIARGAIRALKVGAATRITAGELDRYVKELAGGEDAPR